MGSVIAWLTTLLVAALAALLAVPYFVNWNDYRDIFEAEAAKVFGRAVHIEGDIHLTFLPTPMLNLRGVRIADEFGSFTRPFAEVETFNAVLSLPAILTGTVETKKLELDQPVIRFAVDELGEGNWQSVRPHRFDLPVRQLILRDADIRDGLVEFRRGKTRPPSRIENISGTLSAESLSGPFRFTGQAAIGGDRREMKLSGALDGVGLRVKGFIRSGSGASIYQVDGEITGFYGPLKYSGPVVARLALDKAAREAAAGSLGETLPGRAVELRASSTVTLEDVKLENMAFTLTQDDRPQSLSGSAFASWGDRPRLDISVDASWFDIDQMLRVAADNGKGDARAQTQASTPAAALAALPELFTGWSFKPRQGSIKAKFRQTNLGGEMIEGLDFAAVHDHGDWRIDKLTARLPGATDVDIKGTVPAGDTFTLAGQFKLKGKYLSRLLRWAAPSLGAVDTGNAQNFSLTSDVTLGSSQIAFKSAKGEFGDSSFSGELVYDYGEASQLALTLQSERLDLRPVFGGRDLASSVRERASGWTAQTDAAPGTAPDATNSPSPAQPAPRASLFDVARTVFNARRSKVSVRVAHLHLPSLEARDVRSVLRYENGTLDIGELNLATTDGLSIKAEGRLTGFEGTPDGALTLAVWAPKAAAVGNLGRLAGLDIYGSSAQKRLETFAPLQLSGHLSASRRDRNLQLTLAGKAAASELSLSAKLDGDFSTLNDAKLDVGGVIANGDGRQLIAQLAPEVPLDPSTTANGAGALNISVSGAMKTGLTTKLELRTPDVQGRFQGLVGPLDSPWSASGDLSLRASRGATALSMLRLTPGGTPVTGALDLRAAVSKKGTEYKADSVDARIGGETVGGSVSVDVSGKRPVAALELGAGAVILPKIAAYLVDWDRKDITSQLAEAASGRSLWPNHAFSFRAFEAADGTLKLKAKTLSLNEEITLSDAVLQASLKDGALTLTRLDGGLYGGSFEASGALASTRGRVVLDARAKLEGAILSKITIASDGKPVARGKAALDLEMHGEGLSPRGLISVISGEGQVRLQNGKLSGLTPAVLRDAADAYLAQDIPQKKRLIKRINTGLRRGILSYPGVTVPLTVKDGMLRIRDATVEGKDYKAKGGVLVDLGSLRIDSEWDIAYTGKTRSGASLPPVQLVFAGPLHRFATLEPQVHVEPLERFLSMRRMEQDMDKLEKLNGRPPAGTREGGASQRGARPSTGFATATETAPAKSAEPKPREKTGTLVPSAIAPRAEASERRDAGTSRGGVAGGWNTGTEQAGSEKSAGDAGDFEARMRRAIESGGR